MLEQHLTQSLIQIASAADDYSFVTGMRADTQPFWKVKTLADMSQDEWESLCDGCGRCCLHKLEDIDTGLYFYTDIACRLLNRESCQCSYYPERMSIVKDCVLITSDNNKQFDWLPVSCAYRRLFEDKPLEWWHPLVSGDPDSVHKAGISVRNRTVCEEAVSQEELEDHIISWIDF